MLAGAGQHDMLDEVRWYMNGISSYLLTVLSVSIICALLKRLFEKQDVASGVIRLLTGILVTITIIRPVISISLNDFQWELEEYNNEASSTVEYGEAQAKASMETFIIEQTEAYILNEAKKFQLDLHYALINIYRIEKYVFL